MARPASKSMPSESSGGGIMNPVSRGGSVDSRRRSYALQAGVPSGYVLVYGGNGAVGSACVSYFKMKNWWVSSIDYSANNAADANIIVEPRDNWVDEGTQVLEQVKDTMKEVQLDTIICVAGGWIGGNAASEDLFRSADVMWKRCVWPSLIAAKIATQCLKEGGLIILSGAKLAMDASPDYIAFGMAKAAVHQLTKSLADPSSGLPPGALVLALLPLSIDTPGNRMIVKRKSISNLTPLSFVTELIYSFATGHEHPINGSLVMLITKDGNTEFIYY